MSIVVTSLTHVHPDGGCLFSDISFTISKGQKAALLGNNGVGKSTLLKLLAKPDSKRDDFILSEHPYYVPQHLGQYDDYTIAQALGISDKLFALHAILSGDASEENFNLLDNDDWDIEEKAKAAMNYWNIAHLDLMQPMKTLSGGEKTKVFLSGISIHTPSIVILDEPSNHLDMEGRRVLYDFVRKSKATILVVSHDRALLNLLNTTIELFPYGVELYGGNYDFYKAMRANKLQALKSQLEEKEKQLKQTQQRAKEMAQQRQKQEIRAKKGTPSKGLARIVAGGLGAKAEETSSKLKDTQTEKMNDISESLSQIRQQIQEQTILKIDLSKSPLHRGKILIGVKDMNHTYSQSPLWEVPLNFQICSGDRIRICGNNGSGKTTLLKILTRNILPTEGEAFFADFRFLYIDQEYTMIDHTLSVFEQVQRFNDRHMEEHELKILLHHHQLTQTFWDRQCGDLSGGEKMKLLLCCVIVSNSTPDMIILDEPANNLDIYSLEVLAEAIKSFAGTVLVISHDQYFIENIGTNKEITL